MTTESIQDLIGEFLSERRESDGGYAPVHEQDLVLLHRIIDELRTAKWGRDPDGDLPIEYSIVDRTKYERSSYRFVPYLHGDDLDDTEKVRRHEDALLANLERALERFRLYRRCARG